LSVNAFVISIKSDTIIKINFNSFRKQNNLHNMKYLILQNPGHNRVYYQESQKLAISELQIVSNNFTANVSDIEIEEIAGIKYISFSSDERLCDQDIELISNLSFCFAIYQIKSHNGSISLLPILRIANEYIDNKISNLLKYKGKTNELFTRMMINIAKNCSKTVVDKNIKLLDPVAGKGTTLYEAAVYGYDAYGIEIEPNSVHELLIFYKKFLETERIKHNLNRRRVFSVNNKDIVFTNEFNYYKKDISEKQDTKILSITEGNAENADNYFKKKTFDIIVGDLPYGISHGNKSAKSEAKSKTRNPFDFLKSSLISWKNVLKSDGCIVLAWNSNIISKFKINKLFEENGFNLVFQELNFEHMVDKSIKRDIVIAIKP
jgi:DNA modification methylase